MCSICGHLYCPPGCPNYIMPNSDWYCIRCGLPILNGQDYLRNENGEFAHEDCINGFYDLAEFCGVTRGIKEEGE